MATQHIVLFFLTLPLLSLLQVNVCVIFYRKHSEIFHTYTIMKSLVLSQVVHLLMFNPVHSTIIKQLNKMFFKFVWQTQTEKVRRCDVVKHYSDGGLKMVDVEKIVYSFRLRWIGRMVDNTKAMWKNLANYWFNRFGGLDLLLNSDYQNYNVHAMFGKNMPLFYVEMIKAWSLIDKSIFGEKPEVEKNILWYNQNIVFNKNPLFYKEWFQSGIIRLEDIMINGRFKTVEEIISVLQFRHSKRCAIFDYAKLRQAIPKIWSTQILIHREHDILPLTVPKMKVGKLDKNICDVTSKYFYNVLLQQEGNNSRCCFFWENLIEVNIPWKKCFERNLVRIKDNKLREFNFKVLYNLLPVKRNLCKWKFEENAKCNACNVDEDMIHALIRCKLNNRFWIYVSWLVKHVYNLQIDINVEILLKSGEMKEIDEFISIAFWCIYKLILLRNYKGVDYRETRLNILFASELKKRLDLNKLYRGKNLFNLPNELYDFV